MFPHLDEQLVDDGGGLVSARLRAARRPERVKLIDKEDRGRRVSHLVKRLADAARTHAGVDLCA